MVGIRRPGGPAPSVVPASSPAPEVRETPSILARDRSPLPRGHRPKEPTPTTSAGFFARVAKIWREHRPAIGAVLMGATALPSLAGCASVGVGRVEAATLPTDGALEALRNKALEIEAKKGSVSHSELNKDREKLFADFARSNPAFSRIDQDKDGVSLAREIIFGTSDRQVDSDGDKMSDGYEIDKGFDPASPQLDGKAATAGWTHGYIPMSKNPMIEENTLFFYDMMAKATTGVDPQTRHAEGRSALDGGHYFLSSTLEEKNAELTAAMDFNGDGVLTPNVEHDFLSPGSGEASFGADGKVETTLSVGWWGHCNDVASAGINFREPKSNVTFELPSPVTIYSVTTAHGSFKAEAVTKGPTHTDLELLSGQTVRLPNADVTSTEAKEIKTLEFTPRMLKELASELVHRGSLGGSEFHGTRFNGRDATITMKDGTIVTGGLQSSLEDRADVSGEGTIVATNFKKDITLKVFDFSSGRFVDKTLKASDIQKVEAENARDVNPVTFHEIMLEWIGSEGKAGVMDRDAGPHVWNYSFDRYEMKAKDLEDGRVEYETKVFFVGNNFPTTYKYELSFADGKPVSGKWNADSPNPDFFWRDKGGTAGYDHDAGSEATPVDFKTVLDLLSKSYAAEDSGNPGSTNTIQPN
ncbi:MAG: hypothetical protein HYV07_27215 [Deltaproteobacteria bacterium]|nr:hypothetical protein [Deltaproteobacteria bacterium]